MKLLFYLSEGLLLWSSVGVVTFGLFDHGLDKTGPFCAKQVTVSCTASIDTITVVYFYYLVSIYSLLRITI